jgi:hypothetical protein
METTNKRKIIRNFAIELVIYGILVTVYFIVVLENLGDWLLDLYQNNLTLYAFVALALIVVQAVVLEWVTTFLIERLGLDRLE